MEVQQQNQPSSINVSSMLWKNRLCRVWICVKFGKKFIATTEQCCAQSNKLCKSVVIVTVRPSAIKWEEFFRIVDRKSARRCVRKRIFATKLGLLSSHKYQTFNTIFIFVCLFAENFIGFIVLVGVCLKFWRKKNPRQLMWCQRNVRLKNIRLSSFFTQNSAIFFSFTLSSIQSQ